MKIENFKENGVYLIISYNDNSFDSRNLPENFSYHIIEAFNYALRPDAINIFIDLFGCNNSPRTIKENIEDLYNNPLFRNRIILIRTHNPIVMNAFIEHKYYDHVLVENGNDISWLEDIRSEDFLVHFALGDLYEREDIVKS